MQSRFFRSVLPFAAAGLLSVSPAIAQTNTPNARDQNAPTHFDAQAQRNENLSERLDRTDGVIRPPAHVDPKMQETPPPTGDKGVVIPAPGAPGGDPTVKPK